jgi:hypothetical protein
MHFTYASNHLAIEAVVVLPHALQLTYCVLNKPR